MMFSGSATKCKKSFAAGPSSMNQDIECAKSLVETISLGDPTGLLSIAAAFMHPICGKD